MSEEMAAVCSECGGTTQGKIYAGYICEDCYIGNLKAEIAVLKEDVKAWRERYNAEYESNHEYRRFKIAYEVLFESVQKRKE